MTELKAGRELDCLIAEKVMGWTEVAPESTRMHGTTWYVAHGRPTPVDQHAQVPRYSTSIADAWEVVEKVMERDGMYFELERNSVRGSQWRATFSPYSFGAVVALGPTAPLAICLAALSSFPDSTKEGE